MKAQHAVWKKQRFENLLLGLFVVMMLAATQACSDPLSANEAALEAETASSLKNTEGDKTAANDGGQSTTDHSDDHDDPNAPPVGNANDDGGDDDGTLDGDYPDANRPGNVIICHVPPGNPDNAHSLSISPNAAAAHSAHPDDYDGPCTEDNKAEEDDNADQGNDDQDDANAPVLGGDDDGGDDDGTLDGDYPDVNRPGNVIICHVPPGNPDNAHSLSISPNAAAAHSAHPDDYDGPCTENNEADTGNDANQDDNDQDDANAAPVGGNNGGGGNAGTTNNGRGSSG